MVETNQDYYDVVYYDEWLEVEDFKSVPATDEDEALEQFWAADNIDADDKERYDIREVEYAFHIPTV